MSFLISIENQMDEWHTDSIQEIKRTNLEIIKPFEKSNEQILETKKSFEKSNGQIWKSKNHSRNQTDKFWTSKNHLRNHTDKARIKTYNYFKDTPPTP